MGGPNVILIISYPMANALATTIQTNASREGVEEILEAWVASHIGKGSEKKELAVKDVYTIQIGLDTSDDTLYTASDTGSDSLTCGIVTQVFNQLDQISMTELPA